MNFLKSSAVGLLLTLTACASVHEGKIAKRTNVPPNSADSPLPLKVSGKRIPLDGMPTFELFEITLENESLDWVKIDKTNVMIDKPGTSGMSVVVGKDLEDWARAAHFKASLENYNRAVVQESATITALVLAAAAGNSDGPSIYDELSLGTATGVYVWVVNDAYRAAYAKATQADKTPSNHLLTPVAIPAKMFQRRWILLNVQPEMAIQKLVVEINTVEGKSVNYAIYP